jgi:hypothetical protein
MDKRITPHQNAHLQSLTSQHRIPSFAKAHFLQRSTEKVRLLTAHMTNGGKSGKFEFRASI